MADLRNDVYRHLAGLHIGFFETAKPTGPVSTKTHQKTWTTWTTDPLTITGVVNDKLVTPKPTAAYHS